MPLKAAYFSFVKQNNRFRRVKAALLPCERAAFALQKRLFQYAKHSQQVGFSALNTKF